MTSPIDPNSSVNSPSTHIGNPGTVEPEFYKIQIAELFEKYALNHITLQDLQPAISQCTQALQGLPSGPSKDQILQSYSPKFTPENLEETRKQWIAEYKLMITESQDAPFLDTLKKKIKKNKKKYVKDGLINKISFQFSIQINLLNRLINDPTVANKVLEMFAESDQEPRTSSPPAPTPQAQTQTVNISSLPDLQDKIASAFFDITLNDLALAFHSGIVQALQLPLEKINPKVLNTILSCLYPENLNALKLHYMLIARLQVRHEASSDPGLPARIINRGQPGFFKECALKIITASFATIFKKQLELESRQASFDEFCLLVQTQMLKLQISALETCKFFEPTTQDSVQTAAQASEERQTEYMIAAATILTVSLVAYAYFYFYGESQ